MQSAPPTIEVLTMTIAAVPEQKFHYASWVDYLFSCFEGMLFQRDLRALGPIAYWEEESDEYRGLFYVRMAAPCITGEDWEKLFPWNMCDKWESCSLDRKCANFLTCVQVDCDTHHT